MSSYRSWRSGMIRLEMSVLGCWFYFRPLFPRRGFLCYHRSTWTLLFTLRWIGWMAGLLGFVGGWEGIVDSLVRRGVCPNVSSGYTWTGWGVEVYFASTAVNRSGPEKSAPALSHFPLLKFPVKWPNMQLIFSLYQNDYLPYSQESQKQPMKRALHLGQP